MHPDRAIAFRKQAAILLECVVNEELLPKTAINCWPYEGNEDLSVWCAYTMLWFLECDDERHGVEDYYSDVQLQELRTVAHCLRLGEALPAEFINSYRHLMVLAPAAYDTKWVWLEPWWLIKRVWNKSVEWTEMILSPLIHKAQQRRQSK